MADSQIILQQPLAGKLTATALSDQPPATVVDSRDVWPIDAKTGRSRLAVRPGYATIGSLAGAAGFAILGNASGEPGGIQLFAFTSSGAYTWTGSGWGYAGGSLTASASRTIHAASYGNKLYVACNDPYKSITYGGSPTTWNPTSIPTNCRIISRFGPRLVLLADPANPDDVNFSKADDPDGWDTSDETSGGAVTISIGEAATSAFEHTRGCFIVGTRHGMWVFRGNPKSATAILEKFTFVSGPINSSAWCKAADEWVYYIGIDGLYKIPPGCGDPPQEVSRNRIPDGLLGLDGVNSKAYLVYNERFRGVEIHIQGDNAASWFYDVDGGGFWPMTAPGSGILAAFRFGPLDSTTAAGSLIGTSAAVMRLDNTQPLGGASAAYATLLMPLAQPGNKGLITKSVQQFAANTDDTGGTVALYCGATAEFATALTTDRKESVTIGELQNNNSTWYPRVGGTFAALKITQADTAKHWALEAGSFTAAANGIERGE